MHGGSETSWVHSPVRLVCLLWFEIVVKGNRTNAARKANDRFCRHRDNGERETGRADGTRD